MPFNNCQECHGNAKQVTIVEKFSSHDCGHVYCLKCGISHDSNVDEISTASMSTADVQSIENEDEYRRLFVETSKIRDEFGRDYAKFDWDDQNALRKGVVEHVLDSLNTRLKTLSEPRILDLGCGSGFTSIVLADTYKTSKIISLDPSPQVLEVDGYDGRVRAIQGTIQAVNEGLGDFDAIIILGNLMLHDNPLDTLRVAAQHLSEDGILIFDFKNIKTLPRLIAIGVARMGLSNILPQALFSRNFVNMRYGFHAEYISRYMSSLDVTQLNRISKPPRLLEFSNKSAYIRGWKGVLWRVLDRVDRFRREQAWIQLEYSKRPS